MSDQDTSTSEHESDEQESLDQLEQLSRQFRARIEGLRELLEAIAPHAAALDRPDRIKQHIERSGLPPEGRKLLSELLIFENKPGDGADEPKDAPADGLGSDPDSDETAPHASTSEDEPSAESVPDEAREFTELIRHQPSAVLKVLRQFTQGFVAPRASLLNGSLLTVAIASFEFLLAGLYAYHQLQHPKQLETDEKEFSLAELVEIGSIQEAQQAIAERRVEAFMSKRLDEWSTWSERLLGPSFDALSLDAAHLNEMFQRRHIIVHSGGKVDRRYLQRVELSDEPPDIGDELPVSDEYLYAALDELEVLGYALFAVARSKWQSESAAEAAGELNGRILDLMQADRWAPARKLAEVGGTLEQVDSIRWVIQVNLWISAKRLDEFEDCKQDVESWDVTALADKFKLAKACLLGHRDSAFELLASTLKGADVIPGEAWDWPLLDGMRDDERFAQAFAEVGYSREDDQAEGISYES